MMMKSNWRLRILVILAFVAATILLYVAYERMQENVESLVESVELASRPDRNLITIKELWTTFRSVSNNVRAYTVTKDDRYLEEFLDVKDEISASIDSLKLEIATSEIELASFDSLQILFKKKVEVHENLLDINYNRVLGEAISKMKSNEPVVDTAKLYADEGNILQRLFSSKYSRKTLAARADSLLEERNNRLIEYNRNVRQIREEEAKLLQLQSDRELQLLELDISVTEAIEKLIARLELDERFRMAARIELSNAKAEDSAMLIRNMMIGGVVIILLLFILVLVDIEISDRRKRELLLSQQKAEKLAGAREEFIATMSHEIRTPLTSVIGFSDKLALTELNDDQKRCLEAIRGSSGHLLAIVNDVLDYTRIESGKLKFDKISFNVSGVFHEVYDALKWKADEKNIALNLFIQPVSQTVLMGDPVRLRQVLFNLGGNAIKFTHKGSVDIFATCEAENDHALLLFKVSDTGIGIEAEKLESIFEEFEQTSAAVERVYGGTGLGLTISKKITDQQNGSITVESSPGVGTVFSIRIPYQWGDADEVEVSYSDDPLQKPFKNKTFILAEDDPLIRELSVKSLRSTGAKVLVAENGKQAIELLRQHKVDLMVLDIQMPELSGPEAIRIIRNEFSGIKKAVPVIAMTANVLQHDIKEYLNEGINDYVTKPFKEQELIDKISRLLNFSSVKEKEIPADTVAKKIVERDSPVKLNKELQLYNLTALIESSNGNNDFVKKMINLFLTSSYASVNNLKFHLKQNNFDQLEKTAHRMIGSYKQMGVTKGAEMLKQLESIAPDPNQQEQTMSLVNEIDKHSREVFDSLKSELLNY